MKYESTRVAAYEANMRIRDAGLVVLTWGNASVADHVAGVFAIKPSGVAYDELSPERMVIVSIGDGTVVDGDDRPSSDTPTHRVLFAAWPGVAAIVHTHSTYATAFAQTATPIPCMGTTHADHFAGPVPVARHPSAEEIAAGYEAATGDIIVERFADEAIDPLHVPAVLLPHHGPFAWGPTSTYAVENAIALEAVAKMASISLSISHTPAQMPERLREKHYSRKHGTGAYYGQPRPSSANLDEEAEHHDDDEDLNQGEPDQHL